MLTTVDAVFPWLEGAGEGDRAGIARMISAASSRIERFLGRKLQLGPREQNFSLKKPQPYLLLHDWPIRNISSLWANGIAFDTGALRLLEGGMLGCRQDWQAGDYILHYTAGYSLPDQGDSDLPADIEEAAIFAVRAAWSQFQRDPTLRAIDIPEVERREFWRQNPGALPSEAMQNLASYRAPSF